MLWIIFNLRSRGTKGHIRKDTVMKTVQNYGYICIEKRLRFPLCGEGGWAVLSIFNYGHNQMFALKTIHKAWASKNIYTVWQHYICVPSCQFLPCHNNKDTSFCYPLKWDKHRFHTFLWLFFLLFYQTSSASRKNHQSFSIMWVEKNLVLSAGAWNDMFRCMSSSPFNIHLSTSLL